MRIDIMTVFPEFFGVLDVSLVGKARQRGLIDIGVHDVRSWTRDVHRTVDDTPFGGGAGMVMKPDVWGEAIDDVRARAHDASTCVLAIPTPSGEPLTQKRCYELAQADHMIIACGRYEGIDSRVAEYYATQPGVTVYEYSLGDYVLNGGEVAATALIEAVGRLVPGMVGNPESLVEESHGEAGLLEYPVYTRPADFRGIAVPDVLTSGNHGAVARWRRDRALERTAQRRPDMVAKLENLDKKDCATLARLGWIRPAKSTQPVREVSVREAVESDVERIVAIATETFPDACPKDLPAEAIATHIAKTFTAETVAGWIADPQARVTLLDVAGETIGYSLVTTHTEPGQPDLPDLAYLSKFYLRREWRGSGAAALLMDATFAKAAELDAQNVWVGTHKSNRRAIKAYKKAGFTAIGTRIFTVGDVDNSDVTLAAPVNLAE